MTAMTGHLDYLDKNRGKIWIETFGNVARYIKERDAAKVTVKSYTVDKITLAVTDNLADSIFNFPLSLRCEQPSGWLTASALQNGKKIFDTIVTVNAKKYVLFQAVPNGGDIVLSGASTAIGEKSARLAVSATSSFPIKRLNASLIIDPRRFQGTDLSITLINLQGKELARYFASVNAHRIVVPIDKISRSTCMVKMTDGSRTYAETLMPCP